MTATGNPTPLPLRHRPVRRLVQLHVGLVAYGVSMALMIEARLGLDPWDVFHQGVSRRTGLRFGWVVILIGGTVGVATLLYALLIGPLAHVFIPLFSVRPPAPPAPAAGTPAAALSGPGGPPAAAPA